MPTPPETIVAALAHERARNPGRPLVTFYDDASAERVELSLTTFDNWVSKIANLMVDELVLTPGDTVAVDLPTHWQSTVCLLAAWTAGLGLALSDEGRPVLRVVGPDAIGADVDADHVLACSLRPMAARFVEPLPPGWLDFAVEVPPQPDALLTAPAVARDDVAVSTRSGMTSHAELVDVGRRAADESGLRPGGRLLTDLNPADADGLTTALVAPIVTGSSVVLLANTPDNRRHTIANQERVTCSAWATR